MSSWSRVFSPARSFKTKQYSDDSDGMVTFMGIIAASAFGLTYCARWIYLCRENNKSFTKDIGLWFYYLMLVVCVLVAFILSSVALFTLFQLNDTGKMKLLGIGLILLAWGIGVGIAWPTVNWKYDVMDADQAVIDKARQS